MKKKILFLAFAFIIAMPMLFADNTVQTEVDIQLFEVVDVGFIGGDNPFEKSSQTGNNPTHPNDFCATIFGRTLHYQ